MKRWVCTVCGWIYDPKENGGIPFEELPDDFTCPECGADKSMFDPLED